MTAPIRNRQELQAALEAQAQATPQRLGQVLLDMGLIMQSDLAAALHRQGSGPWQPIGEILVDRYRLPRGDLEAALLHKLGYVRVDVERYPLEQAALARWPWALLQRLSVLPLAVIEGRLVVAMADPRRRAVIDELVWAGDCSVWPVVADEPALQRQIRALADAARETAGIGPAATDAAAERADRWLDRATRQTAPPPEEAEPSVLGPEDDNALVKLVNDLIIDAQARGASDIHIETHAGREPVRIRLRLDGRLRPYMELPHTLRAALVARIKIMCALDISERRRPQDGKINFAHHAPGHALELRVVTIPTLRGQEDVVMRLLKGASPRPLHELGLHPQVLDTFRAAIERPHGLVLCAGPTGSGKTTTLHSALALLNTAERKIWTAEDPIEITQPGLRQVQINPRIDWTFDKALRSFLRADPDVIMIGEVRDRETARTAVEAALTGHLVLSTIHTNSAVETITRLLDMGMDPFNFGDSLLAVMGQRLVRRLCPHCRHARAAHQVELDELLADHAHAASAAGPTDPDAVRRGWMDRCGVQGQLMHWQAPGCLRCDGSGLSGRVGLHELLQVDAEIRRLIHAREPASRLQAHAQARGMRTLRQDGIEKVLLGLSSIEEVRSATAA